MIFEKDQKLNGFIVLETRESGELRGRTVLLEHEKTGAQVFWVDNGAENMVFSVTFRTLPEDSTGVFHILEHSVLCGSEKYPVKEPFVELLKSSMNTFLNGRSKDPSVRLQDLIRNSWKKTGYVRSLQRAACLLRLLT